MSTPIRVLYVDDDHSLLEIGKMFLEPAGDFCVETVDSASTALKLLESEKIDVVVSDYQMPGMDGIKFLIEVRKKFGTIPFILFTGKGREEVVIQAINNGVDFYLQKGGDPDAQFAELIHKIKSAASSKWAEDALRKSENLYQTLSESSPDMIYLVDREGIIQYANQRAAQVFGLTPADLIGKRTDTIFPTDIARHFMEEINCVLTTKAIRTNEVLEQYPTGARWISTRLIPLAGPGGEVNQILGISTDITESKRTEEARQINIEHLRLAQEIGQTGSWELDLATGMIWGSEEAFRIFAIPRQADGILSLEAVEARIPERERVHRALTDLIEAGAEYNIEYTIEPGDNSGRKIVHSVARILTDAEKKPVKIAGVTQDVTGLRKADEAWKRQSKTLSILNGIIVTANKAGNLQELISNILEESLRLLDFDAGGIYLVDRTTRIATIVHSKNLPKEVLAEIQTVCIDTKPYDTLFIKNEPIITENYAQISPGHAKKSGFQSLASFPLMSKGVAIGALNLASMKRHVISEEEKQALISISGELGSTIERMAAEEEAKRARNNLETLFNSINEMVFVLDMQGNIITANNTVSKRLLYSPLELTGMNVLLLHVPERREEALRIVQGMIAGTIDSCPVPVLAKDGTRIQVETKVTPGWWNNQEVLIGVSRDITERKRAENDLKESEEKYRILLDESSDPTFSFYPDGTYRYVNRAFADGVGKPVDAITGRKIWDVFPREEAEQRFSALRTVFSTGESKVFEVRVPRSDGDRYYVTTIVPVKDDAGSVTSALCTSKDITERKRTEVELRESEEKFRLISENSPDHIIIQDHDLRYVWVLNPQLGLTIEEMVGKTDYDILSKADADKLTSIKRQVLETGETVAFNSSLISQQGEPEYFEGVYLPKFNNEGKINGLMGYFRNITEQKETEEALNRRNIQIRNIFENIPIGMFQSIPEGKFVFVNLATATMLGYNSAEELVETVNKTSIAEALYEQPGLRPEFVREVEQTRGSWKTFRNRYRKKDGTIIDTLLSFSESINPDTGEKNLYGFIQDITESKRAEEAMQHALAEREVLLREVHHRVKNNLAGIISLIGLQTATLSDPSAASQLRDLESRIRSMALVHESLYQTKDLSQVNSASYTENLVKQLFQVYGTGANIPCRIDIGDITMPIETAIPCGLVMSEIITNSLKYAFPTTFSCQDQRHEPCTITINLKNEGGYYLLTIEDNGIGIPEGSEADRGHSLGLYLIRLIVEHQLRGTLQVSTAVGTAYTIRFPVRDVKEQVSHE